MYELPDFEYFPDPVGAGSFEQSTAKCDRCNRARGWIYVSSVNGAGPAVRQICPWCIAENTPTADWDVRFNDFQGPAPERVCEIVNRRTPGIPTWQDWFWPACCDDACVYLGEVTAEEAMGSIPEVRERLIEGSMRPDMTDEEVEEFLSGFGCGSDMAAYKFRCRHCGGYQVPWDMS